MWPDQLSNTIISLFGITGEMMQGSVVFFVLFGYCIIAILLAVMGVVAIAKVQGKPNPFSYAQDYGLELER